MVVMFHLSKSYTVYDQACMEFHDFCIYLYLFACNILAFLRNKDEKCAI